MVIVRAFQWACIMALVGIGAQAQDTNAYKIGDKATQDIVASVPFDVVDAQATAALKASKAANVPAIFRENEGATNAMAKKFLAAFAKARATFSNAVQASYQRPTIDNATIESSDFGYFVTAYNVEHKNFPVTAELAVTWARGDSGEADRNKWLGMLLQTMAQSVRQDKLPANFVVHRTIRVVRVSTATGKLSLNDAWHRGQVMAISNAPTLTYCRAMFRRQFSANEQPLAAALAKILQPDCLADPELTREARDAVARQIVVADHFDAGQVIVRRGETIDARALAALEQLNQELAPGTLNRQIAAEQARTQQEHDLAQQEHERAQMEHDAAQLAQQQQQQEQAARKQAELAALQEHQQATVMQEQALNAQNEALKARERDEWLLAALGVVSVLALAILWGWVRQRRTALVPAPAKLERMEKPSTVPAELAPYLAQTLKEAVVQGLAAQRAELLEAQRQAAAEIAELVHRLDQLQAPMQERVRAYQERIQELQKDLAERTEENRELLKLKIEMMRRQIETENGRARFN